MNRHRNIFSKLKKLKKNIIENIILKHIFYVQVGDFFSLLSNRNRAKGFIVFVGLSIGNLCKIQGYPHCHYGETTMQDL